MVATAKRQHGRASDDPMMTGGCGGGGGDGAFGGLFAPRDEAVSGALPRASRRGGGDGEAVGREAERLLNASGRRGTTLARVLAALLEGPKTNWELMEITPRYSARIFDLRSKGLKIRTEPVAGTGDGTTLYSIEGAIGSPQEHGGAD